jgi:2-polyprenyl-3-methyl-5-hydroxy-6-metoxy-1,4-benzoquinol methylase
MDGVGRALASLALRKEIAAWWDANPCNARHSDAFGQRQYHTEVTRKKFRAEPHLRPFADPEAWAGKRVYDAGCGIGTVALEYAQAGADVTAVDVSAGSLDILVERLAWLSDGVGERLTWGQENIEDFCKYPFDLVWCWGVLHHTPNPLSALQRFSACLDPGGVLKLMVYHRRSTKALGLRLRHAYTPQEICGLVTKAGFEVTSCRVDHIFKWSVPHYIRGEWVEKPWVRALPPAVFAWLEQTFGWHILVEARAR